MVIASEPCNGNEENEYSGDNAGNDGEWLFSPVHGKIRVFWVV